MKEEKLVEDLAKVLYDDLMDNMGQEAYNATYGYERDSWENAAEFNKDDYRSEARAVVKYLKEHKII
jgi:hypothetical protein